MTYRIDFSSIAKAEADAAFLSFSQFTTDERAQLWYQGLIKTRCATYSVTRPSNCNGSKPNKRFNQTQTV